MQAKACCTWGTDRWKVQGHRSSSRQSPRSPNSSWRLAKAPSQALRSYDHGMCGDGAGGGRVGPESTRKVIFQTIHSQSFHFDARARSQAKFSYTHRSQGLPLPMEVEENEPQPYDPDTPQPAFGSDTFTWVVLGIGACPVSIVCGAMLCSFWLRLCAILTERHRARRARTKPTDSTLQEKVPLTARGRRGSRAPSPPPPPPPDEEPPPFYDPLLRDRALAREVDASSITVCPRPIAAHLPHCRGPTVAAHLAAQCPPNISVYRLSDRAPQSRGVTI